MVVCWEPWRSALWFIFLPSPHRATDRNRLLRVTGRVVTAGRHGRGCGGLDESARATVTPGSSRCAAAATHPYLLTPTLVWPLCFFFHINRTKWNLNRSCWWVTYTGFWKIATNLTENLKNLKMLRNGSYVSTTSVKPGTLWRTSCEDIPIAFDNLTITGCWSVHCEIRASFCQ